MLSLRDPLDHPKNRIAHKLPCSSIVYSIITLYKSCWHVNMYTAVARISLDNYRNDERIVIMRLTSVQLRTQERNSFRSVREATWFPSAGVLLTVAVQSDWRSTSRGSLYDKCCTQQAGLQLNLYSSISTGVNHRYYYSVQDQWQFVIN